MPGPKKTNRYNSGNGSQNTLNRKIDELAEYDEFCNNVLPKLRKMVAENKDAGDMYKAFQAMIAARVITEALTTKDPKMALAAAREILDRGMGKAKETINVNNRYEQLSDEALDQLLKSEQEALDEDVQH
jgi:hypothetical protein